MHKLVFIPVVVIFFVQATYAQQTSANPWTSVSEYSLQTKSPNRRIIPSAYRTMGMNVAQMKSILESSPLWQTPAAENENVILTLPMPDGTFQDFRIVEAPVLHPELGAQYPMIRSYAGIGLDDPSAYLRCDFTPSGFHAMVLTEKTSTVFIDPYSTADLDHYIVYYKKDFQKKDPFVCLVDGDHKKKNKDQPPIFKMAGDCQLRTYTLALACTGEYANFHGGTITSVLAAMNTTMTRVNGVFEKDVSVHMDLHPNNTSLIFLDPNTDPYSNGNGSAMLGQNQTTCDNIIGNANYDIGHVFSTGGGGVAYLRAVCSNSIKAGGVTGQANPVGDPFDIDYVAHEMGHQYGANHTQNNNCNRNSATAMEPGSASTIMGYAGICSPNVQNNSDDYFHAISIQEMAAEITSNGSGGGNTCSTNSTINAPPTADAGLNYTIPRSTPFVLTGSGTDPDGDPLTYTWEQMDNQVATMPPSATSTGGPAFRSFKGTSSPNRYLPRLVDLVNNTSPTWEVLASVSRTYNWRLTVRDNHLGGGCTAEDNTVVTVTNSSGPFIVTAPNTSVTWPAQSTRTVTWDVANTTASPVSCANVDIFLSLDGGFTYPITLATATPNDGSHDISVPNNQTSTARVMVRGSNNIFFDISNQNFTIGPPENNFTFDVIPNALSICTPTAANFDIIIGVTGTFSGNVTLDVSGLPAGATATFSLNPVPAPGTSQLIIGNTSSIPTGEYDITISGTGSTGTKMETVTLIVSNGLPGTVNLVSPLNGATNIPYTPVLEWNSLPGSTYDLEVATDLAFSNIILSQTGIVAESFSVITPLNPATQYYWRVRGVNSCGVGAFSSVYEFTTINIVCTTFVSTDVPKTISASGTPTVTSILSIPTAATITDLNVLNLDIDHTYIDDLIVRLKSPDNTERILLNRICGSQNNILLNLDSESANLYSSIPCPPNGGTYRPFESLTAFNGKDMNGTWTLTVNDVANQDGGSLQAWSLEVCYIVLPPLQVSVMGTNVTCNGLGNGTAQATASGGTGTYSYEWNNGSITPSISGLTPGAYTVTVTSGAQQITGNITITEPSPILISAIDVVQPTCATPSGSIVVNASGPGPLEYSSDNGGDWQSSSSFLALSPGNYEMLVRLDAVPACSVSFSGNPVVIENIPTPPSFASLNVVQPVCSNPQGTIQVNASGMGPLEYSNNGGNSWQSSNEFSGLIPGNYAVLARLISDPTCETAYVNNPVTIHAVPVVPIMSAPDVVQPTCAIPSGTIQVNATGTGSLEYSVDAGSSWQPNPVFSFLPPGSYTLFVRLVADTTCETVYQNNPVVINNVPANPIVNTPDVTHPTCAVPSGTIQVNASGTGSLEYSADGGIIWQSSPLFSSLPAGNFNLFIRLEADSTCETGYASNPVWINSVPAFPSVNAAEVTQPTCAQPFGTILVDATGAGNLEYSADGGLNWQANAVFLPLSAGDYHLFVRLDTDTTCVTTNATNPVIIQNVPEFPVINGIDVVQPGDCQILEGSIDVFAAANGTIEYREDNAADWQLSNSFYNLPVGNYVIAVRLQADTTCLVEFGGNPVAIEIPVGCCVTPTFSNPCTSGDFIDDFTFGTFVNSGTGCADPGTENRSVYLGTGPVVQMGKTYEVIVKAGPKAQYAGLFIDLNMDGKFLDSIEFFDIGYADVGSTVTANVTIPMGLVAGTRILRVRSSHTGPLTYYDGCNTNLEFGETEDYNIYLFCPDILEVASIPIPDGPHEAHVELSSTGQVQNGSSVVFQAGQSVVLQGNFEVILGGVFEVVMQGCFP